MTISMKCLQEKTEDLLGLVMATSTISPKVSKKTLLPINTKSKVSLIPKISAKLWAQVETK